MNILREALRNFNTCLFTEAGTPLPLSDDEKLLYAGEGVEFYAKIGEGGLLNTSRHASKTGTLFITNYRMVYIPAVYQMSFCSFFVPSTGVIDVLIVDGRKVEMTVMLHGDVQSKVKLDMKNNLVDTMIMQLRKSQEYLNSLE
ncbi:hypothetical protein NECID01_1284 [Nematocida sp. AWRm77]|nr:hypothetical protein NECID01_1284 [Nematocida sp. AWRm77]